MAEAVPPLFSYIERVAERQAYLEFLTRDTPWVLLVTGLEGNGKTEFLRDIQDPTSLNDMCVVYLNFAMSSLQKDALSVLARLVERIESFCDEQRIRTFKDILQARRDKLSELSIWVVQQHRVGNYGQSRDANQTVSVPDDMAQEKRQQIRAVVTEAFYAVLDSFRLSQLVILLDNCEWINEIESSLLESIEVSRWLMDELLPDIHERMQAKNKRCSVVIASSIPPTFRNINERAQQRCNLDKLDKASVDRYFQQLGIEDSSLRHCIYENITYGHACCVWIVGEILQTHRSFTSANLPQLQSLFKEQALHKFLHVHIFGKHPESRFRNLIHYGALLRSFDQPLLEAVFPEWMPPSEAFHLFHKLILYPYIIDQHNSRYAFIDLIREVLTHSIRYQESAKWQEYNQRALNFLKKISHLDRFYHALACNEQKGLSDWIQAVQEAYSRKPEEIAMLLEIISDKTLILSPTGSAERSYQRGQFYEYNKQYDEALEQFEQAQIFFRQVDDSSGEDRVRQKIDEVQQRRAEQ